MSVPAPVFTMKLDAVIVVAVIASLNVTLIADARGMVVELGAGEVDATCGGVRSGGVTADEVSAERAETAPSFPFAETAYLYATSSASPSSRYVVAWT